MGPQRSGLSLAMGRRHSQWFRGGLTGWRWALAETVVAAIFSLPLVDSCQYVLLLLVPFTPFFQIILVMQSTGDVAAAGEACADVGPSHASPP